MICRLDAGNDAGPKNCHDLSTDAAIAGMRTPERVLLWNGVSRNTDKSTVWYSC